MTRGLATVFIPALLLLSPPRGVSPFRFARTGTAGFGRGGSKVFGGTSRPVVEWPMLAVTDPSPPSVETSPEKEEAAVSAGEEVGGAGGTGAGIRRPRHESRRRRQMLVAATAPWLVACSTSSPQQSSEAFAETIGKDPDCNDSACLGVWDGLLADCPHVGNGFIGGGGAGCASSQDDAPGVFSEPWDYSDCSRADWEEQSRLLLPAIQRVCDRRGDGVRVLFREGRYLRVAFEDGKTGEKSVGEFYFTPDDTTVQFRIGSLADSPGALSSLRNVERAELIRKELSYLKLPVLRNRKRSLFFVESDFDTFGPGSAALGPPSEMRTGELEGRFDADANKKKTDLVQDFPVLRSK